MKERWKKTGHERIVVQRMAMRKMKMLVRVLIPVIERSGSKLEIGAQMRASHHKDKEVLNLPHFARTELTLTTAERSKEADKHAR
jgi:hypothetical protein